ncbi:MAG: BrnA antitoxin family protein [Elusimicrobiota bacterium]|jgi:uncharacterized protein (DUF4415 family)
MRKRRILDPDAPVGKLKIIPNFLPPPHELLPPGSKIKITIELDEECVDFFKEQARRHGGKYQRMMREILRLYAARHAA